MNSQREEGASAPLKYPHIIVRTHACNYQREALQLELGEPHVHIGHRTSSLTHPGVDSVTRGLSQDARAFLTDGVLRAVRRLGFRTCIVWGPGDCTYAEADGVLKPSTGLPRPGTRIVATEAQQS